MTVKSYVRGHEIYYDTENKYYRYTENNKEIDENGIIECVRCNKLPVDNADYCMQGLLNSKLITNACCGHGVQNGYIMLADGRYFEEKKMED